jgi:membrane protein required for colicin V production
MIDSSTFDIIVFVIMLISALISFFRGFAREVLTLIALIGAGFGSWRFGDMLYDPVRHWLTDGGKLEKDVKVIFGLVPQDIAVPLVAHAALLVGIFIILSLLSLFVSSLIKEAGLGTLDRLLGIAFGLARGFLIVAILFYPFTFIIKKDEMPAWFKQTLSAPYLIATADLIDKQFNVNKATKESTAEKAAKAEEKLTPDNDKTADGKTTDDKTAPQDKKDDIQDVINRTLKSPEALKPIDHAPPQP